MGLQYSITAIGAIILQYYVNALGEEAIAGFTSGYKIKNLILCPLNALGTALSSFVGQNFGAKRFDRISEGFKRTLEIGLIYSVITMVVCFFTGKYRTCDHHYRKCDVCNFSSRSLYWKYIRK